jgi:four helix bundle protein
MESASSRRVRHTDLCQRTEEYSIDVARFAKQLLRDVSLRHAGSQLIRASASVASNYRAVGLARSRREFIAKLGVVIEEADECVFWLGYIQALSTQNGPESSTLSNEATQLLRIFKSSRNTARRNGRRE